MRSRSRVASSGLIRMRRRGTSAEDAEVTKVLGWARDWNTRSRNSAVAQGVFNAAVRTRGATAVLDLAGEELILAMEARTRNEP